MISLKYKDTITVYKMAYDGYADETIEQSADVACLFLSSAGELHYNNTELLNTDAHAYLDPHDPFLVNYSYRLDGMLIKANLFGGQDAESWFRVRMTHVLMDKLLANSVDTIHVWFTKAEKPKNAS